MTSGWLLKLLLEEEQEKAKGPRDTFMPPNQRHRVWRGWSLVRGAVL